MTISECDNCGATYHWDWTEAFCKFGFNDGDGQVETWQVADVLTEAGYSVELNSWGVHNTVITSIKKNDTELILYADDDHGEYHILTETLKGRDMDANRLIVRDRPMQFRKQSSIGYIETSHSLDDRNITLLFIPTLRLFTSHNQDPTATGLNSQEIKLIISLLTDDLLKTDKPLSTSTSSLDVSGKADQDGGYYEMYMKSKSAYVSLCNSRDR